MTSLRTSNGINKQYISTHFDKKLSGKLEENIKKYIAEELVMETTSSYILTTKGKLFADRIAGDLFI